MARTLNPQDHLLKRETILAAAERAIYSRGFEAMSVQHLLEELNISKGAFYHYFTSKQDLLEAVIDHMQAGVMAALNPILSDPALPALQKLERYFSLGAAWKAERRAELLELLRVWYTDPNALVRQKVLAQSLHSVAPLLADVLRQGAAEGVFQTTYPEQDAQFILLLLQGLGDAFADILIDTPPDPDGSRLSRWPRLKTTFLAYSQAIERVLGAAPGTVRLVDVDMLKVWLAAEPARKEPAA